VRGVPASEVGDYHHRPFEPFGGVDRHKAHRVSGFERRARDLRTGLLELSQPAHHREGVVGSMLQVACQLPEAAPVGLSALCPSEIGYDRV